MTPRAELLLPPPTLASCIAAAVFRDTTRVSLNDTDRLNFFPASPLFTVTRVFSGQLHMHLGVADVGNLRKSHPSGSLFAVAPQPTPVTSWSPSEMRALTVCLFPDAWIALGGTADGTLIPESVEQVMLKQWTTCQDVWADITRALEAAWQETRSANPDMARWAGSHRVSDWARYATTSIALTGVGKSLRSMERRLKRRTLQSRQSIEFFAKLEGLHARSVANPGASPAELAVDAEFSDQSHMGRSVKRATGFSPKHLNARIAQDEAFWCYRLLGERF